MQGIEILNKEQIYELSFTAKIIIVVAIIMIVISGMLMKIFDDMDITNGLIIAGIIAIASVFTIIIANVTANSPTGRNRYEATIDDDVSINEVYKHYNVIERKGKKWILEDKAGD